MEPIKPLCIKGTILQMAAPCEKPGTCENVAPCEKAAPCENAASCEKVEPVHHKMTSQPVSHFLTLNKEDKRCSLTLVIGPFCFLNLLFHETPVCFISS